MSTEPGELQSAASPRVGNHEGDVDAFKPEVELNAKPPRYLAEAPLFVEVCCGSALLSVCVFRRQAVILFRSTFLETSIGFVHVVSLDLRKKSTGIFWNI